MIAPSFSEFKRLTSQGNLIPIVEEIHFDWETPISAFRKIDDGRSSFLLESVEGGEKWARYSYVGSSPSNIFRSKKDRFEILKNGEVIQRGSERDPLKPLERFLKNYRPIPHNSLPRFSGGAVGYIGYDMVRHFENLPDLLTDDLNLYDSYFMITKTIIVFDNLTHRVKVISNVFLDEYKSLKEAYEEAEYEIREIVARLKGKTPLSSSGKPCSSLSISSNLSREEFMKGVERAKEYIKAGDVIQVVLSQRFSTDLSCRPFDIYRSLRSINPSPYLFYLNLNDVILLGASPEVLVRLDGKKIELRPLAGTRRRGITREEDQAMERELLEDEKERAEHIMLVDLGRNDVGRVAKIGSVKVTELMGIERYSHVMHIVSNIQGTLAPGKNAFDVFRSAFPAGTVTGAPKIRAMEIIEEIEPVKRGPYAGAVGYFSFSGNMDTCITIRSILIKDGTAFFQTGAGIVADSYPEKEYEETINKAQAIFRAIKMAEEGLS